MGAKAGKVLLRRHTGAPGRTVESGVGRQPNDFAPAVADIRTGIQIEVAGGPVFPGNLFAPDDPDPIPGVDSKLGHPDVRPRAGQGNMGPGGPLAVVQPVEADLVVRVIVGSVGGVEGTVTRTDHRGKVIVGVAAGKNSAAMYA